jgi:hypothetical protein
MSPCKEDIYINLPGRYRLPKGKVLKLKKYIYGLRQSAFHWHQLFAKWLTNYGFKNIDSDGVTWVKTDANGSGSTNKLLLTVHVDEGLPHATIMRCIKHSWMHYARTSTSATRES